MRSAKSVAWCIMFAVVLIGCAPASGPERVGSAGAAPRTTGPKILTAAITGVPPLVDNRFNTTTNSPGWAEMANFYNSKLSVADYSGGRIAQLAEAVPTVDNGGWKLYPDGTMDTRFTIRPGVTWHDGTPYTTRDLLFTYEVSLDRELPQSIPVALTYLDRVEAVDARTMTIHWKGPFIQADRFPDSAAMPAHILEKPYREDKQTFLGHPYMSNEFVGSGPFKLSQFEAGSHIRLAAYDQYVLGRPKIDEVEVRFIPDLNTMLANILTGTVDLTMGRGVSTEQGVNTQAVWQGGRVEFPPTASLTMWAQYVHFENPVITDLRFHRAVMHAINRQEMVDSLQFGRSEVAHINLPPSHPSYAEILARVPKYPHDPRRAGELLQQTGYARGTDGLLQNAAGQRLAVEIRTTVSSAITQQATASIASDLRLAGMEVTESIIPTLRAGDRPYRVSFPGLELLRGGYGEDSLVGFLRSTRIPTAANNYASGNYPSYSNPEWDALLDRYAVTIPYGERMKVMSDMYYFLGDQLPQLPLFFDTQVVLVANRLLNIPVQTGAGTIGWDASSWDIK